MADMACHAQGWPMLLLNFVYVYYFIWLKINLLFLLTTQLMIPVPYLIR